MKSLIILVSFFSITFLGCNQAQNQLSKKEQKQGWILMFDGQTTIGWRAYNKESFPKKGWEIEDGVLKCLSEGGGGDLIFDAKFKDFELKLDWRVSKGANSGVFYHALELPGKPIYFSAPEIQILDNENHSNGKVAKQQAGSLFDVLPAVPQNANPYGEWNSLRVVVKDNKVLHYQNGKKVVEYSIALDEWRALIQDSKFKNWEGINNKGSEGYIGLQDHGNEVWFRNLKIRKL